MSAPVPSRGILLLSLALTVLAGACGSKTRGESRSNAPPNRRVLLADEIQTAHASNASEVVQRLRPEWLRDRGPTSILDRTASEVVVYLDGMRFGGPRSLANISVENVVFLEFLTASEATTRFGTGHTGGAIVVRTQ